MKQQQEEMKAQGEKNKTEGQKYLDQNKNKAGVKTTADGLQYEVIKEGTGKQAAKGDMVKVQLRAMYTDGKEFDNTYNRAPVSLPITEQIIPAWREALMMMKEGGKMRIVVPPNLGWGEAGMPPTIPPNSVLIFEIELVSVDGKAPAPGAQPGGPRPQ
jgi:FKBP-type peptidyl-prolyl cis-trans isomerase FkpA/FKBP-type peptidyl-prolyl cis-trans isomerase FklB